MRKKLIFLLIVFSSFWGCLSLPEHKEQKTVMPTTASAILNEKTNIHFTGRYCSECHERTPVKGGDPYLKYNGDYQLLCRCHHGMSPGYCHPLDINSKLDQPLSTPAGFPLQDGKFTCETCHDIYRQCQKRLFDRYTLRGAPYPRKTDFCYRCHDKKKYPALDAHRQIRAGGALETRMCLYCHANKPDEKTATYKEVTFIGDTRALCRRCHAIEGNHPGNFDHMAEPPSAKALKHMAAKGADSKYRQRLPGILCIECHQM